MRFKADENLPVEVVDLLRQHGHDAMSVGDQQLSGHPDVDVAQVCRAERRALVTLDLDFSNIRAYPPEDHAGIVVLRPAFQTIDSILRLTGLALSKVDTEPLVGRLWIVTENQIRIRGTDTGASP